MQRAGALVDVIDALPGALRARGHEISVALPFYREIRDNRAFKKKDTGITVEVQVGDATHVARYFEGRSSSGVQLFFIGVVGEYIGAIHTQVLKRPLVVEKERINFDKGAAKLEAQVTRLRSRE